MSDFKPECDGFLVAGSSLLHCLQLPGLSLLAVQLPHPGNLPQVRMGAPRFIPEPLGQGEIIKVCHRLPALFPLGDAEMSSGH